jgi:hypothetical protein
VCKSARAKKGQDAKSLGERWRGKGEERGSRELKREVKRGQEREIELKRVEERFKERNSARTLSTETHTPEEWRANWKPTFCSVPKDTPLCSVVRVTSVERA